MSDQNPQHISVRVLYFGLIKDVLHLSEENIILKPEAKVHELLTVLADRHGASFHDALFAVNDKLLPNVVILLNGSNIMHQNGIDTLIEPDSSAQILLMPPLIGGG